MTHEIVIMTVKQLLDLRKNHMLSVNPEYQRGPVWTVPQQKKLIDSVLRSYPLPLIYLHHKKTEVAGMQREDLEIIDGQQRLNALDLFLAGGLNLYDPIKDDKVARFPKFIKEQDCPWAGQTYDSLNDGLKQKFLDTKIFVAKVVTDYEDEARDLFIRLQAGLPLNPQEKRDAWPGGYTEFVLKFAGKPNNTSYPGHNFFKELVANARIDRGQVRQLCAQIGMLYFEKATNSNWLDIGTSSIDDYYYKSLGFNFASSEVTSFRALLDKVYGLLGNRGMKKLKGHEAIHLLLLVDKLMNEYTPSWEGMLLAAFEVFRAECVKSKSIKDGEYWTKYVQWTMTSSDTKTSLQSRHNFFTEKMYALLKPQLLDKTRAYGALERQIVYYRDKGICGVCGSFIVWDDLEIHHVLEHQHGGQTTLQNALAVHHKCHPRGQAAIDFAKEWFAAKETVLP